MTVSAGTRKLEAQITKLNNEITALTIECGGLRKSRDRFQCQYNIAHRDLGLVEAKAQVWKSAFRLLTDSLGRQT
jgi:hypothetical protein